MYKLLKRLPVYLLSMLVVVMILIILPTEAEAATYYSNGFYYSLSNGKATITGCHTSVSGALVIPATINSYPVTAIGNDAFYNCTALTSVTIPDGVTSIGNRAFKNCHYLTDITIPASVTRVGLDSFVACSRLTSVHITDLAAWCDIWFGSELITLYSNPLCYADNLYLNGTPITDLVIPDSVTDICTYAFAGYSGLTRVTIPDGVTNVGEGAFYGCNNLISVTISDSVTTIGDEAFYSCDNLSDVTIGKGVTSIGSKVFHDTGYYKNASNWENDALYVGNYFIVAKPSITGACTIKANTRTIAEQAFISCTGLTSVTIPNSVIRIPSGVFHGCSSLESITIPFVGGSKKAASATYQYPFGYIFGTSSYTGGIATTQYYYGSSTSSTTNSTYYIPATLKSVTVTGGHLNYGAFYSCDNLSGVTIGNGVTSIGDCAFVGCSELTSITIPDSVTSIGKSAFYYCEGLTSVIIGNGVTSIGNNTFEGCNSLTSITIPNCVTKIREQAFKDCTSLTFVTIPDSITTIEHDAFYGCSSLNYNSYNNVNYLGNANNPYVALISAEADIKSCVIHNDTKMIADYAFDDCRSLTSVTISDSVTSIGKDAFYGCHNLTGVYITDLAAWCKTSFWDSSSNPVSYVTNLYLNNQLVTELVVPDSVTSIGDYVFAGCATLSSITIHDSITSIGKDAFYDCYGLTDVYITDLAAWCKISFSNSSSNPASYATNLYLNNQLVTELMVPDSITSIGDYAFYDCDGLTSIIIPDSVTHIGDYAFYDCDSLTSITLPKSVNAIGKNAFYGCGKLTHVWYGGSENDRSNITGDKPVATWHYNCCNLDSHTYDNTCDDACNSCKYPREAHHVYDDADDVTCNVCKQILAPAAPTVQSATDTTVTLYAVDGYEYSMDAITWQQSNVFIGLQPATTYNFYQRVAAGANNLASPASKPLSVQTDKYVPDIPWDFTVVEITDTSVSLNQVTDCEYSIDGRNWKTSPVFTNLTPGTRYTFYQRIADNSKHYASASAILHVSTYSKLGTITYDSNGGQNAPEVTAGKISTQTPSRSGYMFMGWALTPYTHAVYKPGDSYSHQEDIILYADWEKLCSNCGGDGEYLLKCSRCSGTGVGSSERCDFCDGKRYTYKEVDCTYPECRSGNVIVSDTQIIDCPICKGDGICEEPVACSSCDETGYLTYPCSACSGNRGQWLTCSQCISGIQKFTPEAPQMPKLQSVSCNTVVLVYYSTCEYSIDGVNWQDSNVFSNLDVNRTYLFYQRYKEATYTNHSNASPALSVTTLKESILPPQPPVLQSKTFNKVILEKVDGCEYSLDGINWQTSNVFDDLHPSTSYTFYCRFAETATHLYSATSNGLTVVTEQSPLYNVVFVNWNGTVISSNTYRWGDEITVPANPTKAADNTYTYTFAGWDNDVVDCVGNATYTATYTPVYINYTVVFKDWDDTVLSTKTYHWGDTITVPASPTKEADNTHTYTFAGWDNEVVSCAGNATYTATYTSSYINYTVVFKNWDGTVLSTKTYHWGDMVTAPTNPTKAADNTYTYAFTGWDNTVVNCAGNATYTASFTSTYIDYTVVFKNWDGNVISTRTYHWGDVIAVPASPTKAADNTYTYTFAGWDNDIVACTGNATYTATFTSTYIDYIVVFKNWDGTVLSTKTYHWGDVIAVPAIPTKAADNTYTYAFAGWDKSVVDCAGNATYTATFTPIYINYTVVFKNWDGSVISTKTYHYGTTVTVPANPTRPEDDTYIYTFTGWDKTVVACNGNAVYTAVYSCKTRVPAAITSSTYTISNGTISKIYTGTTVSTLVGKLNEGSYVKVYNGNQEVAGSVVIGTGMVVKIMDGNTAKAAYTIVVTGDTNGDGKITVTDMLAVKAHVLKKSTLSGASAQAADTSGDNAISITDFIQMKAQILGKSDVEPRAINASAQHLSAASVEPETSAVIVTAEHSTTSTAVSTLNYTQVVAVVPDKKSFVTV